MEAQKIAVTNSAGFVMNFQVNTNGGHTDETGNYPIGQTQTIDLAQGPWREGVDVWPEVHAILGKTQSGPHITFKLNGQTASYNVHGATLTYDIDLVNG